MRLLLSGIYMFDENEEENEKKNQRTNGRRRLTTLSSARGDISCILIVFQMCARTRWRTTEDA